MCAYFRSLCLHYFALNENIHFLHITHLLGICLTFEFTEDIDGVATRRFGHGNEILLSVQPSRYKWGTNSDPVQQYSLTEENGNSFNVCAFVILPAVIAESEKQHGRTVATIATRIEKSIITHTLSEFNSIVEFYK